MRHNRRYLWQILGAALLLVLALSATTAYACGCGIYIPSDGNASVAQERSVVRWDGQHEDIVLSLGVLGTSKDAAIIVPVPSEAKVTLGNAKLFDELDEMTKPLVKEETEWVFGLSMGSRATPPEAAAGGAPPVTVLSRQNLGPFDVANLTATDSTALKGWLDTNGFTLDPRITEVIKPYVESGWTFVAIRLQPEEAAQPLGGMLTPLQLSFDSNELVYPMRSSALADKPESLNLYVLADHRVDKEMAFGSSRVSYADWVDPTTLAADSTLAPLVPHKYFLTKFVDTVNPVKVHDDFKFTFASADTTYRDVNVITVQRDATGYAIVGCLAAMVLGVVVLAILGIFLLRRRGARASAA